MGIGDDDKDKDGGIIKGNGTESGRIITTTKKGLNDQRDKVVSVMIVMCSYSDCYENLIVMCSLIFIFRSKCLNFLL